MDAQIASFFVRKSRAARQWTTTRAFHQWKLGKFSEALISSCRMEPWAAGGTCWIIKTQSVAFEDVKFGESGASNSVLSSVDILRLGDPVNSTLSVGITF